MTIRFFMLQAHYRSTLDFSNEALEAAEKGLKRLFSAIKLLAEIKPVETGQNDQEKSRIIDLEKNCYEAMNEDFNSPVVIANLFEGARIINSVNDKKETISAGDLDLLKKMFNTFVFDILGLKDETTTDQSEYLNGLMELILKIRQRSRENKDWSTSDQIRDALQKLRITVKDSMEGSRWEVE